MPVGLLGMIKPYTMGGSMHVLPVLARIVVIVPAIQGQGQMTDARMLLRYPTGTCRAIRESNTV
jgi:hypothetical protein